MHAYTVKAAAPGGKLRHWMTRDGLTLCGKQLREWNTLPMIMEVDCPTCRKRKWSQPGLF